MGKGGWRRIDSGSSCTLFRPMILSMDPALRVARGADRQGGKEGAMDSVGRRGWAVVVLGVLAVC